MGQGASDIRNHSTQHAPGGALGAATPSSERLVRSVLHKWMPRSGLTMTASPPTASPPSEPAVAPQALYSPLHASGRPRGANG